MMRDDELPAAMQLKRWVPLGGMGKLVCPCSFDRRDGQAIACPCHPSSRAQRFILLWWMAVLIVTAPMGCVVTSPAARNPAQPPRALARQATTVLKRAISYTYNPAVRISAIEALVATDSREALPWIRSALLDEHPAVRFAACVAVGSLEDATAEQAVRRYVDDPDPSVQVAALFALHRLGDTKRSGRMPAYLLDHDDITVRRNAAMLLGLLGEPGAIKVLARAMKDEDPGVRNQALEAMAKLGNQQARQELAFMTNSGVGTDEVFAIHALASLQEPRYLDTFRYKMGTAIHIETRLAAAAGLALLGSDDGFDLAERAMRKPRLRPNDPNDPPAEQALRIRQLAAGALGAMKRKDALPALAEMLTGSSDPRIQVSAAQAILEIDRPSEENGFSLAHDGGQHGG